MMTAKVVVFMPPAVEPELPPMNISKQLSREPLSESRDRSAVFMPAVRVLTEWNREASIRSPTDIEDMEAVFSLRKNRIHPISIKAALTERESFECRSYFLK